MTTAKKADKLPSPPEGSLCNSCIHYDDDHSCWQLQQLKDSHHGAMPLVRDCPKYSPKES